MNTFSKVANPQNLVHLDLGSLRAAYASRVPGERLVLPTIQRNLVWDHARIVNYWDTLRRGWFPGMMMVRALDDGEDVYEVGGKAIEFRKAVASNLELPGDFELFDGQQRMSAIMLGFGQGQLSRSRRLWIGFEDNAEILDTNITFRISTTGQPFGYRIDKPNEKATSHERREALKQHMARVGYPDDENSVAAQRLAFELSTGDDLVAGGQWWPLSSVMHGDFDATEPAKTALTAFANRVVETQMILRRVLPSEIDHYNEFFRRIGQGGVSLSDAELTYALINKKFPMLRPSIDRITMDPEIGRLASSTDLALALLRLARIESSDGGEKEWQRAARPNPEFTKNLPGGTDSHEAKICELFGSWLALGRDSTGPLVSLMTKARQLLSASEAGQGQAVSPVLLSRLPKGIIEIALLLSHHPKLQQFSEEDRRAFCYWAMFFGDAEKIIYRLGISASETCQALPCDFLFKLIGTLSDDGHADVIPTQAEIETIRLSIQQSRDRIIPTSEWFSGADQPESGRAPSKFFENLFFWNPRGKNLLLWLQGAYFDKNFPGFDPTSDRDEDLPIDLDHIVGSSRFNFRWGTVLAEQSLPIDITDKQKDIFRSQRSKMGNLIGNLRWLCSSHNRSRSSGGKEGDRVLGSADRTTQFADDFDRLLAKLGTVNGLGGWEMRDLHLWQQVVLCRTLTLTDAFLTESGIRALTGTKQ